MVTADRSAARIQRTHMALKSENREGGLTKLVAQAGKHYPLEVALQVPSESVKRQNTFPSEKPCAGAGTLPPPLLDGRKSGPSTARASMYASIHDCQLIPKVGKSFRAVAPLLSHTLADRAWQRANWHSG